MSHIQGAPQSWPHHEDVGGRHCYPTDRMARFALMRRSGFALQAREIVARFLTRDDADHALSYVNAKHGTPNDMQSYEVIPLR